MTELRQLNDELMTYYDMYEASMSEEAGRSLRNLIGQPMLNCKECSRGMYRGFAGVICLACTNR